MLLAANFYLPSTAAADAKIELVNNAMEELGLSKTRDTIIGDEKIRGVSGGERKRANIAVQLISDPAVLFLDEPTSGLDSFQAMAIMDSMKAMALNNRLVVAVIHQPRSNIFDTFDKLLLLSEGRTIYLGNARDALKYFEAAGFPSPLFHNPADFFLDVLSPDFRTPESTKRTRAVIHSLAQRWVSAEKEVVAVSRKVENEKENYANIRETQSEALGVTKTINNFCLLFGRAWKEQTRALDVNGVKIFTSLFFGLIIGGIYSGTTHDQASIRSRFVRIKPPCRTI